MSSAGLPESYEEAAQQHMRFYNRVACTVSIAMVLAGVGLDVFFYPEKLREFAGARVFTSLLIGVALWGFTRPFGERHIRALTYAWIALPQLMVAWMVYQTNGEKSVYFVGLTLAIAGIGVFLPLTAIESTVFSLFTIGVYLTACALQPNGIQDSATAFGQIGFFLLYALIAITISIYGGRWRLRNYLLQKEIQKQAKMLTERNQALAEIKGQLIQREKMAAIGTLSAGLLHELNNPVNYSLMAINMAMTLPAVKTDDMLKESLVDAKEGLDRIQNIVSDLKTFAYQKPGDNSQRPFLLENSVRSAVRLAGFELKGITVVVDLPQDTHVVGDEPAIIGVLINLLSNAAHAVHGAQREQPSIGVRVETLEKRLKLTVRDNGLGIAGDVISRVFDPFFTTRDIGSGLGLGLSMSYSIVQRHGSTLEVSSEPGAWTEFTFDLARP